jgi:hypothetical protein
MRIFLVGTGPSLNSTPLDRLIGEDSFSLNKIHYIYPKTAWRPTYFYYVDHPLNDFLWKVPIDENKSAKHLWLLDEYRTGVPDGAHIHDEHPQIRRVTGLGNVTWIKRCPLHSGYSGGNPKGMHEWHFPEICTAYNGMSAMIQISVQMGYDEIYLLGCDLGYQFDYTKNHFHVDYAEGNIPPNKWDAAYWAQSDEFNAKVAHEIAKTECAKRGVKVYNATIGGSLEVYPRISLEEVLNDKR